MTDSRDHMADHDVDLFVIGAGSGGVRAARIAAGHGASVMVAEEYRVGGTCVIRGCVPKKLLVYASRYADDFEDAAGYGWTVPEPAFDWPKLIANKDREIARLELAYVTKLERAERRDRQEPRGAGGRAYRASARKRRRGARKGHPDRDRRGAASRRRDRRPASTSSPRTRRFISTSCPSAS